MREEVEELGRFAAVGYEEDYVVLELRVSSSVWIPNLVTFCLFE